MKKPELLAPAGTLEKLITAVDYGADAVYFGIDDFSLRAAAGNFSIEEAKRGLHYAHTRRKKCYLAFNVMPHSAQLERMSKSIMELAYEGVDAFIVSDPGVFSAVRDIAPTIPVHISTQANTVNHRGVEWWYRLGARRVVLARELSLEEIAFIRKSVPRVVELECFVHGAMCISYSGRCLLSNYLTGRDSNLGECAHPCRWKYNIVEEKRPGEYYGIEQDGNGTYIMNSKDMCMIRHIPELVEAGISSFKIEGRVKSAFYVATITNAYRIAIDSYFENPSSYEFDERLYEEVCKVSHREYYTGFYFGDQGEQGQTYGTSSYIRECDIVATVDRFDEESRTVFLTQKNRFCEGDTLEAMGPSLLARAFRVSGLKDENGEAISCVPHPEMKFSIDAPFVMSRGMMLRRDKDQ